MFCLSAKFWSTGIVIQDGHPSLSCCLSFDTDTLMNAGFDLCLTNLCQHMTKLYGLYRMIGILLNKRIKREHHMHLGI